MGLEDLLKPLKFLDEQVLRQYTKLTNFWENKRRSKYTLAMAFSFGSLALLSLSSADTRSNFSDLEVKFGLYPYSILLGHDMGYTLIIPFEKKIYSQLGIVGTPFRYLSAKIQRATRLVIFGLGMYAFSDFVKSFYHGDIDKSALWVSSAFVALASSMYVKDSNPKILDKNPFWKSVYYLIRNKIGGKIPQPITVK